MIGRAFAATVFKEQQIAARCFTGYWFGTCGVTGKVTPLVAGGVVGFAVAGVRADYYSKPVEDALVLWRENLQMPISTP